jgi:hypothetical protein
MPAESLAFSSRVQIAFGCEIGSQPSFLFWNFLTVYVTRGEMWKYGTAAAVLEGKAPGDFFVAQLPRRSDELSWK